MILIRALFLLISLIALYAPTISASQQNKMIPQQKTTTRDPSQNARIQSLTEDKHRLQGSVDRWNLAYIIALTLAVIIGSSTAFVQWKTIALSKRLVSIQSELEREKDRQSAEQLASVQGEVASANERAGNADERAGKANQTAGEANAEAGKANERAASLELKAAESLRQQELLKKDNLQLAMTLAFERSQRERLARDVSARFLNPWDLEGLRRFAGTKVAVAYMNDEPETKMFAQSIASALGYAGWEDVTPTSPPFVPPPDSRIPGPVHIITPRPLEKSQSNRALIGPFESGLLVATPLTGTVGEAGHALINSLLRLEIRATPRNNTLIPGIVYILVGVKELPRQ